MPGVAIKTLTKRYGDVAAVEEFSLDVKPGEFVSLLGPSGSGACPPPRASCRPSGAGWP